MKKIIGAIFVLLALSTSVYAQEESNKLILLSQDVVEVSSTQYVVDSSNTVSLIKGSTIDIVYTHDADFSEVEEPEVDIIIKDSEGNIAWSASSPTESAPDPESELFGEYIAKYSDIFEVSNLRDDKAEYSIPLNIDAGTYIISLTSTNYEKLNVEYEFTVSNSPYYFKDPIIIFEDKDFLVNLEYVSVLPNPTTNKVKVIITKADDSIIFEREFDKEFYQEGMITIRETVNLQSNTFEPLTVLVQVLNQEGNLIVDFEESFNQTFVGLNWIIIIIAVLILVVIAGALIFFVKSKKIQIVSIAFLILVPMLGYFTHQTYAQQCAGAGTKPGNVCTENIVETFKCKLSSSCETTDVRTKKFFSTGKVLNLTSTGTTRVKTLELDICNTVSTVKSGDDFYVIADAAGSAWMTMRYSIYKFTRGTAGSKEFDPGGRKRNVQYASYNGSCKVTVTSQYKGADSDSDGARLKVVEAGEIESGMCRSKYVTSDLFQSMGNLLEKSVCTDEQISETYLAGGTPIGIEGDNSWLDKNVNICNYITKENGKNFYVLMEQTSAWSYFKYPAFRFTFGEANDTHYDYLAAATDARSRGDAQDTARDLYISFANKENIPLVKYDGNCNITFKLQKRGDGTDQWQNGYKLLEAGLLSDVSCKDPRITEPTTYNTTTRTFYYGAYAWAPGAGTPEIRAKRDRNLDDVNDDGIYKQLAPFMNTLPNCKPLNMCTDTGEWVKVSTNTDCGDGQCGAVVDSCQIGAYRDRDDTTTLYRWYCDKVEVGENAQCSLPIINDMCSNITGTQTTLPTGTKKSGTECLCSNGATNPVTCTICPDGQAMVNGMCTPTSGTKTLSFDGNGSTSGSMAPVARVVGSTSALPANTYKKRDLYFVGWGIDAKGTSAGIPINQFKEAYLATYGRPFVSDTAVSVFYYFDKYPYIMPSTDKTLYAQWRAPVRILKNLANAGGVKMINIVYPPDRIKHQRPPFECMVGCSQRGDVFQENIKAVFTATEALNYKFDSWSGDFTGTSKQTTEILFDRRKTITANYSLIPPPITNSASATCSPDGTQATITWTRPVGYTHSNFGFSPTLNPTDTTRNANYITETTKTVSVTPGVAYNWFVNTAYGTTNRSTSVGGQITCVNTLAQCSMIFHSNGGTGSMAPQTFYAGEEKDLSLNRYTRTTYNFLGWNTNRAGTGTNYPDTGSYKMPNPCTNRVLYAKWSQTELPPSTYRLQVNKSGSGTVTSSPAGINCGSGNNCRKDYTPGTRVTLTATPATGNSFAGWSSSGGVCLGGGICTVTMNSNQTVQATFSLDDGGGDGGGDVTVDDFSFDSSIANTNNQCSLVLSAQNVTSCTLINRVDNRTTMNATAGVLNISPSTTSRLFSIGTYRLECIKLDGVSVYEHPTTISCRSKEDISEI